MKYAFLISAILALVVSVAQAHEYKLGSLEIDHPWTRATPKGATVAGGYLKITNTGSESDRLVGGSLANAASVEIHESQMTGGVAKMRQCLADKSGGKMKLQGFWGGALGGDLQATQALRSGTQEMVVTSSSPLVGILPDLGVFDLPFLFANETENSRPQSQSPQTHLQRAQMRALHR